MADIQLDITLEIMERCKHLDCLYITLVDTLLSHTIFQTEMGEEGNASIGCLYTSTWMTVPLIIAVQLFYLWISPPSTKSKEIVYEDTHYRVTIVYGFLATNTDFIRIDEVFGPFHREVYQSERYGIDTKKLNSTTAIEAFLKQQKQ